MTHSPAGLSLLALTTLLALSQGAHASLPALISLGPRSAAMAGTRVAVADDGEATSQIPAGLAQAETQLSPGLVHC